MKYNLQNWKFKELGTWMDGGSITLYFNDHTNQKYTIDLEQYINPRYYEGATKIPGRIYLNTEIVTKRSDVEISILKYLKENVVESLTGLDKNILITQIRWIESEEYIDLIPIQLILKEERKKQLPDR